MSSSIDNMRFRQLVFRTIPHSLVEWLDTELEKRNIDSVYTHLILSILQEDSDNTEPEECIDLKHNRQKIYHQYRKPEGLYSTSKSKHQKLRANRKHILSTPNISNSKANISNLERKKRNAAINCLKSVSDDGTIEVLIDEICLRLKNVKNKNATEEMQSEKNLDIAEENMPFYIPPSSPTDQVEKYFAAFPPLNTFKEQSSDQFTHAWYDNCFKKEKNVIQNIFKNSHIGSTQSVVRTQSKHDNSFGSLKSIENLYPPENSKNKNNRYKFPNLSSQDENKYRSCDENTFSKSSVNYSNENIDSNLENMLNSNKNDYGNDENIRENISFSMKGKSTSINKSETDSKRKIASNSSSFSFSNCKKVKNSDIKNCGKLFIEGTSKSVACASAILDPTCCKDCKTCCSPAAEIHCNPFKKFKSSINLNASANANIVYDTLGQLFDSTLNSHGQLYEEKESTAVKVLQTLCPVMKDESEILNGRKNLVKDSGIPDENMNISECSLVLEISYFFPKGEKIFDLKSIGMIECATILKRPNLRVKAPYFAPDESNIALVGPKVENIPCCNQSICNKDNNVLPSKSEMCLKKSLESGFFYQENAHDNITKAYFDERRNNHSYDRDILKIKLLTPSYKKLPHHRVYIGGMNLIKIGPKYYYNFDILKALNYFTEHEIFNIMTVGDFHQINDFLCLFCTPDRYEDSKVVPHEGPGHNSQSCPKNATYDFHSQSPLTGVQYSPSYFLCKQTFCKEQPSTLPLATLLKVQSLKKGKEKNSDDNEEELQFENYYTQKKIVHDDADVYENKESNLFHNLPNVKVDNISFFSKGQSNESQPFLQANHYRVIKNLSGKEICGLNISDPFSSGHDATAENNLPLAETYSCQHANQSNFFSYKRSNPENDCLSLIVEKDVKLNSDSYVDASEISCFKGIRHHSLQSAFKQFQKHELSYILANLKNSQLSLLKKAINIDRVIQKINGIERVNTSSDFLPSTEFLAIGKKFKTQTSESFFSTTSNFMNTTADNLNLNNSLLCENSLLVENNDSHGEWKEQFFKKNENLKSLWKCETSNIGGIWQKPVDGMKNESFLISSDTTNSDLIKNKIEEEHDELLKDLCSMPLLKEETSLPHSSEQNVSLQVHGCPYKLNVENGSIIAEISNTQFPDIISTQNVLNSNNDYSLYVPHVDPITHLSKDNFKNESADLETFGSNNYSVNLENQTYQEPDFMEPSAFKDPSGIYGKNETGLIEGCGWSLNSDDYIFETEEYGDQSSFQNFDMLISEQENFQYMQLDEQQFAFEEDEMARITATTVPAGLIYKRLKHKYPSSFKKPCSYFMEGNCNRSDCKYSHDLSTITCRFWIHGSCFKGPSCPFLHGFIEEPKIEDSHPKSRKREPKNKYSLESEADFPSLSSSKNEKLSTSKSEPVDIVRVKRSKNSKQADH